MITIEKYDFVESSRLLKSLRESDYRSTGYFLISKIELKPIHLILLSRGLRNSTKSTVYIYECDCSSKTIFQFKNLIQKLPESFFYLKFSFKNIEEKLAFLMVLSFMSSREAKLLSIKLREIRKWQWDMSLVSDRVLVNWQLDLYTKKSKQIKALAFSAKFKENVENFNFFKNVFCLTPEKNNFGKEILSGDGDVRINHY